MRRGSFAGLATATLAALGATGGAVRGDEADDLSASLRPVDAHVYHCHDGDTCRLQVAGGMWMNVRLAGVDAPEVGAKRGGGQPMGAEARDWLNGKLKGKDVTVRQVDLDQYNRPVVELSLKPAPKEKEPTTPVNVELVSSGFAEVYRGKGKRLDRTPYEAAEAEAKKAKKGIWGMATYQSPAEFRKAKRR